MSTERISLLDLVFVSFHGKVFAVSRHTGEEIWKWKAPKGDGPVTMLPDTDRLFVSCQGYTWALDAASGRELWFQPFSGEGVGIPMIASMRHAASPVPGVAAAAAAAAAQQAAASAAVIAATTAAASG